MRRILKPCLLCKKWQISYLQYVMNRIRNSIVPRIIIFVYFPTFCIIMPIVCGGLRFSPYYRPDDSSKIHGQMLLRRSNNVRKDLAENLLMRYEESGLVQTINTSNSGKLDFMIGIITVSRSKKFDSYEPGYLTQTTATFLRLLNESHLSAKLFICNVDKDPYKHVEAKRLANIVPSFQRFKTKTTTTGHIFEKEKEDYIFCLNKSLEFQPEYVLLVEDDALPDDNLFVVLKHVLRQRQLHKHHLQHTEISNIALRVMDWKLQADNQQKNSSVNDVLVSKPTELHDSVLFYKLYHPERLLGFWSLERERIPELLSIGALFGTIVFFIVITCSTKARRYSDTVWVMSMLYMVMMAISIGRTNLVSLRQVSAHLYSVVPAPGCCTPAMLYPSAGAKEIVQYLSHVTCNKDYAMDMAIEDYKGMTKHKTLMLQPNLFTHIGLYSSLRNDILPPDLIVDP